MQEIQRGDSIAWRIKSRHISHIKILNDICTLTFCEDGKPDEVTAKKLSKDEYYDLIDCMRYMENNTSQWITFSGSPDTIDATSPAIIQYSYLGTPLQKVVWNNNEQFATDFFRDVLERLTGDHNLRMI